VSPFRPTPPTIDKAQLEKSIAGLTIEQATAKLAPLFNWDSYTRAERNEIRRTFGWPPCEQTKEEIEAEAEARFTEEVERDLVTANITASRNPSNALLYIQQVHEQRARDQAEREAERARVLARLKAQEKREGAYVLDPLLGIHVNDARALERGLFGDSNV